MPGPSLLWINLEIINLFYFTLFTLALAYGNYSFGRAEALLATIRCLLVLTLEVTHGQTNWHTHVSRTETCLQMSC